jgi:hypothetical protein
LRTCSGWSRPVQGTSTSWTEKGQSKVGTVGRDTPAKSGEWLGRAQLAQMNAVTATVASAARVGNWMSLYVDRRAIKAHALLYGLFRVLEGTNIRRAIACTNSQ